MNPTDPPQATENPTGELDVCYECGGQVRRVAGHGRTTRHRGVTYTIPADLALLTCQQCGGLWLGGDDTQALDRAIKAQQAQPPVRAAG